ncbi:sigma-54-dependent transcriptional regulator [Beggiatoa leptomitoformis]|uniref:Response regulator n=1 Tax=Beggiatoa leptomitoformis TaxID=288004 RepID=A0A2N9YIG6_9GAMM|nr:sigma 54-interacting transcriptional regulator [Beggiatoa leptomitoformis]ALG67464.1 response regulator [Beggiatoa leptomitoformis]AUI70318.1 response regulator [Beggiatoa leptomitoformis]
MSDNPTPLAEEEARPLRILLVDDDAFILTLMSAWLEDAGYEVATVESGEKAVLELPLFRPHLVVTDLRMDGMDGIALLKQIQDYNTILPVIMLSGSAQISDAVRATHQGVFEFLTKPVDPEDLFRCVQAALTHVGTANREEASEFAPEIIHRSAIMSNMLKQAHRVAKTRSNVFIGGATGTGKELLARAIHRASPRKDQVFLAINCGALSEQLLESELFGHEKGAFTGAVRKNLGLFQAANGGTLFLDEIGDMPANLQVKLLRTLQDGQVKSVGAVNSVTVDVRIISATHHDLEASVRRGEFREDLFYRLNVIPLYLPPLSQRREDISLLIDYFLTKQAQREAVEQVPRFSPEAMEYIIDLSWPGNVRQLQNVVEQCSVLCASPIIPLSLVKQALRDSETKFQTLTQARKEFDKNYLQRVMNMVAGDTLHAAHIAGCEPDDFKNLLREYAIDPLRYLKNQEEEKENSKRGENIHLQ